LNHVPAICGGPPAFPEGPPAWRPDEEAVAARLREAVARGDWNRYDGPNLAEFVERFAAQLGVEHVLPCSSGTVGVEIALRGAGVAAGDEVILGGYDFPGNFRAIEAIGALPVLIDLDPATRCLDVEQAAAACGPQTKAVIATHLHGGLVQMPRLMESAAERGVVVVEDACQAVGGTVAGRPAGTWGDAGVFSFGGSKLLSAGRGGAVVTRRADVRQRMRIFCERGNQAFPLSELQAAVLLAQLDRLGERQARRMRAVSRLGVTLGDATGLTPPHRPPAGEPAFYKLGLWYDAERLGGYERAAFVAAARAEGIALDAGFRGFVRRGGARCRRIGELPTAAAAAERTLVLHHPVLLEPDDVVDRLAEALANLAACFAARRISFAQLAEADESGNGEA
jgi:dTDP-4-amino-4,6-dideoxygalactose transaminase